MQDANLDGFGLRKGLLRAGDRRQGGRKHGGPHKWTTFHLIPSLVELSLRANATTAPPREGHQPRETGDPRTFPAALFTLTPPAFRSPARKPRIPSPASVWRRSIPVQTALRGSGDTSLARPSPPLRQSF